MPGGDFTLLTRNGAPFQMSVYNTPLPNENYNANYTGLFLKDQWRIGRHLTLNLGVRASGDHVYVPAQCSVAGVFSQVFPATCQPRIDEPNWNSVVPRLGVAYDIAGNGLTVVKGYWGRFVPIRSTNDGNYLNPLNLTTATFRWRGATGGSTGPAGGPYMCDSPACFGDTNFNPNGPDFVSGGFTPGFLNPNETSSIVDEFSAAVERQLAPNLAVRISGIADRESNLSALTNPLIPFSAYTIPNTNLDPGPTGVRGGPGGTGQFFTYYEYPTSYRGAALTAATMTISNIT